MNGVAKTNNLSKRLVISWFQLIFSWLIVVVFSACGRSQIAPEAIPYVIKFVKTTRLPVDFPIKLTTLEGNTVGLCYSYSDGSREIELDVDYWTRANDSMKEELVMHELGHCVLNRDHKETIVFSPKENENIPVSIMFPYVFGHRFYYQKYNDYFLNELKAPNTPIPF
jgi:hypothetical protein